LNFVFPEVKTMKETIYIFTNGKLSRKENTIFFESETGERKYIPVENVKEIFLFGEVDFNKRVIEFFSQKEILVSYFSYYGYYMGTFYPREHYNSGFMIVNQTKYYLDEDKRLFLAKRFVEGAVLNSLKILKYYNRRGKNLEDYISDIENKLETLHKQQSIDDLMALEGQMKQIYYRSFNTIIDNEDFSFEQRTRRPPKDYINTLISFANSMIYNYALSEIYQTHLDPRIGFLHTSNFRRFSLNLDIAEIFKPIIGDRVIFSVLNKNIITKNDFEKDMQGIILKDNGKKKFLQQMEERLKSTIKHNKLDRNVSYRRLIRLELYKLEKHLMDEEEYLPFVMEW